MSTPSAPDLDTATRDALATHAHDLAVLVGRAPHPLGGFGWLSPSNEVTPERGVHTWITCRMTHIAACEFLRTGDEQFAVVMDVGYRALVGRLRDQEYDGWFPTAPAGSSPVAGEPSEKVAYAHAFVILAAASLTAAGHPGGADLLSEALAVFDRYFWDESAGMAVEQWDRAWSVCEDYRGVNANMHTVEAMLAAGQVLGDARYTERAVRIVSRVVHGFARENDWRLPEHFDASWRVDLDYNRDNPADQFRPYGVTIGHMLEWSRLTLNARSALIAAGAGVGGAGGVPPAWMVPDAQALYAAAVARGWAVDGEPDGFVYTTDFADVPVVRERLHWVLCEGIAAAWALFDITGEPSYREQFDAWWAYARRVLIDPVAGGWFHELAPDNTVSDTVWWGKPDLYHAYQATLVPLIPGLVSFAGSLRG